MDGAKPAELRAYFGHVEGLRGVAALYVFVFHIWQIAVQHASTSTLFGWYGATFFLQYGHFAVAVFIVISGYCLSLPIATRPERAFHIATFFARRARRLMPAYVSVVVLSIVPWCVAAVLQGRAINPPHIAIAVVLHVALIHNLFLATTEYLNGPLWSIALESQIYVIFALVLIPVWRRFGLAAQAGVALALGLVPHFAFHTLDWTWPWLLGLFGLGVVAASITASGAFASARWNLIALGAGVVAAFWMAGTRDGVDDGTLWPVDIAAGVAVAAFFVAAARDGRIAPARFLASRPIVLLGTFSYSLYLIHAPLVDVTGAYLKHVNAGVVPSAIAWALLIPVVVVLAYGFYRVFERPFLSPGLRAALDVETGAAAARDATQRYRVA